MQIFTTQIFSGSAGMQLRWGDGI